MTSRFGYLLFTYWCMFEPLRTHAPIPHHSSWVCGLLLFAAILGVHTLVTSTQTYDGTGSKEGYNSKYNHRIKSVNSKAPKGSVSWPLPVSFLDVIKGEKMNPVFDEPPNPTNVEDTLQRIKSNDSSLTEVNLNNIKVHRNTSFQSLFVPLYIPRPMAVFLCCPTLNYKENLFDGLLTHHVHRRHWQ